MPPIKPRRLRKRHHVDELRAVVDETIALCHRVRFVAEQIYGPDVRSGTQRGVLRGLVRYGARTVPQLALARSVSRQHIQDVVDRLRADGLVELAANPAHRRSKLVRPTPRGVALVAEMDDADLRVIAAVGRGLPTPRAQLAVTAKILRQIRERFEADAWRDAVLA
ncbi:MAG TPA: MarR family transcriptional regulator [Kofleriaceae bacterium]